MASEQTFAEFARQVLHTREIWQRALDENPHGMAYNWPGYAWVVAQLAGAGLLAMDGPAVDLARARLVNATPATGSAERAGLFVGPFGELLALSTLAAADPDLRQPLAARLHALARDLPLPAGVDLFVGSGGAVTALYQIARQHPDAPALDALRDRLIPHLYQQIAALMSATAPLSLGFAHGVAGHVVAVELAHRLRPWRRIAAFRRWAVAMLERSAAPDPWGKPMWPHVTGARPGFAGWCNGTPGIVLGFLLAHRVAGHAAYERVVHQGLAMLHGRRLPAITPADSLCCGKLGVAELYLALYRHYRDRAFRRKAHDILWSIEPLSLGQPVASEVPSLHRGMLGWIYIGYELAHPRALPPVGLDLDPPSLSLRLDVSRNDSR